MPKFPNAVLRAFSIVFLLGTSAVAIAALAASQTENTSQATKPVTTPETYQQVLEQMDRELKALKKLAASRKNSWAMQERLALWLRKISVERRVLCS